jgi:hypothetical protein
VSALQLTLLACGKGKDEIVIDFGASRGLWQIG